MNPAAILRAAAVRVREVAQAAPPWPWKLDVDDDTVVQAADDIAVADAFALSGNQQRATAVFIAAFHPGVALAVADWLDATAGHLTEATHDFAEYEEVGYPYDDWIAALAVARALLPTEETE